MQVRIHDLGMGVQIRCEAWRCGCGDRDTEDIEKPLQAASSRHRKRRGEGIWEVMSPSQLARESGGAS